MLQIVDLKSLKQMDFGELNRDMANMDMIIATAVLQLINGNHHFLGDHKITR